MKMGLIGANWWRYPVLAVMALGFVAVAAVMLAGILAFPNLPSLEALTDYQPKIPLRVYTEDGALIGEFGEERRALVKIGSVPKLMRLAILAAEDDRFYSHGGVDYMGVMRAALANLTAGGAREGASTITMQVARNFFLSGEKTLTRKFSEVLLAMKIEHFLSKDQILELYINQIYLGQRAYGFAAAAQTYFGRPLEQLSLAEVAMLAGLPKAPSRYNPVINPKRAKIRQHYVLRRMHDLKYVTDAEYQAALAQPLVVKHDLQNSEVKADYVAEMVRQAMFERYRETIYSSGMKVYTTLRKADQDAANQTLRQGVLDYDRRHGYRGPESIVELPANAANLEELLEDALAEVEDSNGLEPAIVLEASPKQVKCYRKGGETIQISGDGLKFVQKALGDNPNPKSRLRRGALIRVQKDDKGSWQVLQLPQIEAALVSVVPQDGAIRALVGGFDFYRSKFNHVTQAWRQPGSSFKPFVYSAALEKGFTAATVINDAPIVVDSAATGGQVWEPKNFDGEHAGPIRLRTALTKSKNLVSIRILQAIGAPYAQDYIARFGFSPEQHPPYLTMALGAGSVTPMQMAAAYSVFANGGYLMQPHLIDRVVDANGKVLTQAKPKRAGEDAARVIDARNAFIMTSLMRDVVRFGTAARAMQLKRQDLAGKTGTTNDQVDAWFAGFNSGLVAVAWIGFDQPRSMGGAETGAQAALPIWMGYMGKALKGVAEEELAVPDGVISVKINPQSGLRAPDGGEGISEYFYQESAPSQQRGSGDSLFGGGGKSSEEVKDQLFKPGYSGRGLSMHKEPGAKYGLPHRDREKAANQRMRERIAHQAARLIAEDGLQDYALAKTKAARQIGAPDTHNLPNNHEVEQALRDYQALYQKDEQGERLRLLRQQALAMMRLLERFDPHLTGSVLSGTATRHSDINLQIFADSPKDVELFLLGKQLPYKSAEKRLHFGGEMRAFPVFILLEEPAEINITVFATDDLRQIPRGHPDKRPLERARAKQLEALLEEG